MAICKPHSNVRLQMYLTLIIPPSILSLKPIPISSRMTYDRLQHLTFFPIWNPQFRMNPQKIIYPTLKPTPIPSSMIVPTQTLIQPTRHSVYLADSSPLTVFFPPFPHFPPACCTFYPLLRSSTLRYAHSGIPGQLPRPDNFPDRTTSQTGQLPR